MVTVAAKGHLLTVLLGQRIRFKDLIQMKRSGHLRFLTVEVEAFDSKVTDIGDEMCLTVLVTYIFVALIRSATSENGHRSMSPLYVTNIMV